MLGGSPIAGASLRALKLAAVPRHLRRRRLNKMRFWQRKRLREQLRFARRMRTLVKGAVIAVVSGALLSLLALGGTLGALAAHHWWLR